MRVTVRDTESVRLEQSKLVQKEIVVAYKWRGEGVHNRIMFTYTDTSTGIERGDMYSGVSND